MNISVSTPSTYTVVHVYIKHITKLWTTSYKAVEAAFIFREHVRSIEIEVRSHNVILFDARCYFPTLVRGIGRIRTTLLLFSKKHPEHSNIALNGLRHKELTDLGTSELPYPHHFLADKPGCANLQ